MRYKLIILAFLITVTHNFTFSQPAATVQFIGGYSIPMGDLKGSFGSTYSTWTGNGNPDTNTYFMKSGLSYGIYVKVPAARKSNINIIGSVGFNVFSNSIEYDDATGRGTFDLSQSMFTVSLGGEYSFFAKKSKIVPFVGIEMMLNIFSGKLTIEETGTTEYTMNSTTRYGLQFGGGFDYIFHNNLGLSIGAKYAMANLIGKEYKSDVGTKYNLGDAEHTIGSSHYPAKDINFLTLYGGLSFYFGR